MAEWCGRAQHTSRYCRWWWVHRRLLAKVAELLDMKRLYLLSLALRNQPNGTRDRLPREKKPVGRDAWIESYPASWAPRVPAPEPLYRVASGTFRTNVDDLKAWLDGTAAALYELPMRDSGQLPAGKSSAWLRHCKRTIHSSAYGWRALVGSVAYYQKPTAKSQRTLIPSCPARGLKRISAHCCWVMLPVAKASAWMKRQGGNVYHRTPYVVSAAMQFDQRLAQMPGFARTHGQIYQIC